MDRFFSILGKIIIGTIALILVIGTGYYIGTHKNELKLAQPTKIVPTATPLPTKQPTPQPEADRPLNETPTIPSASPSGVMEN